MAYKARLAVRFSTDDMTHERTYSFRGNQFRVVCSDEPWHPSWFTFEDETETREQLWRIQPGDVVLDVGADFGSYSLTALACGAARVYAWSPPFKLKTTPLEAETLNRSAALNGWEHRITVYRSGLYSETGWFAGFDGPRLGQLFATKGEAMRCVEGQDGHCAVFPVDRLDAYQEFDRVDWLKIDTEGCEEAVLRGGEQIIRRCKPRIILEFHYHLDDECEDKCTALLESWGYRMTGRMPHHTIAHGLYEPCA